MTSFEVWSDGIKLKGISDSEALEACTKPTIIKVKGKLSNTSVLVSVLIHGSEPCGFRAMLKELNSSPSYEMDVFYFVGNVDAAKIQPFFTNRLVPGKENYNRIWKANPPKTDDEKIIAEIWQYLNAQKFMAHLDLHSFTAKGTPSHAFIASLKKKDLDFVKRLSEYIFFDDSIGAMIEKTCEWGPSCVIECGTNNTKEADDYAFETLQNFFVLTGVKKGKKPKKVGKGVFVEMTNFKIKPEVSVSWADTPQQGKQVTLRSDVSSLNIKELPAGELIGWSDSLDIFAVKNKNGSLSPSEFLELKGGKIFTKKAVTPNLMAPNEKIAKESGFYFFMKSNL